MSLVVLDSDLYKLELVEKGGSVSGSYDRLTSKGKSLSGTAAGARVISEEECSILLLNIHSLISERLKRY